MFDGTVMSQHCLTVRSVTKPDQHCRAETVLLRLCAFSVCVKSSGPRG